MRLDLNRFERIFFLGLGGAGQRHARILRKLFPDAQFLSGRSMKDVPLLKADFQIDHSQTVSQAYNIKRVEDLNKEEVNKSDLIVISSPTSFHDDQVNHFLSMGANVFCEKPAFLNSQKARESKKHILSNNSIFFVSYQRLYHPVVNEIQRALHSNTLGTLLDVNVRVSSYLPNWHKYEDFQELYAARSDLGGGVLKTECHELYLLLLLFGEPLEVIKFEQKKVFSDIDVEDHAVVTIRFADCVVNLNLNFCSNFEERKIILNGTEGTLTADFNSFKTSIKASGVSSKCVFDKSTNEQQFELQAQYFKDKFVAGDTSFIDNSIRLAKIFELAC